MSSEALSNIRTVAGLGKEKYFVDSYEEKLELPYRSAKKRANVYGICFGFAQCVIFMAYAASFTYGGYLVGNEGLPYMFVFRWVQKGYFTVYRICEQNAEPWRTQRSAVVPPGLFQLWSSAGPRWAELPPSLRIMPKPKLPLLSSSKCWTEFLKSA